MIKNGKHRTEGREHLRRISREQFDNMALLYSYLMTVAERYVKQKPNATLDEAFEMALRTIDVKGTVGEGRITAIKTLADLTTQAANLLAVTEGTTSVTGRGAQEFMTTQEAADHLGVCRQHVVELTNRGLLSFRMVGRYRRLLRKEVLDYHKNGLQRAATAGGVLAKRGREENEKQ